MLTLPVLIVELILGLLVELGMDVEAAWGENVASLGLIVVVLLLGLGVVCLLVLCFFAVLFPVIFALI